MATYFNKYYFEFDDIHITSPARWRVDIMDSEGATPTEPYLLTAGAQPLVTERIDTADDKFTQIIGRQITVTYVYTGNPNEPLPDEFFEATERRFRIEVRKNGLLDGVYYIKPDFSQYPDVHAPFNVKLKAIDGMGYTKGTLFDIKKPDGNLLYDKILLYDALVTRAMSQIFDAGTKVNVLLSLVPEGAAPGSYFLFDNFIHTDIFYDFVTGPKSVHEVLTAFCKNFNARIITDQNQIWFIRVQDLNQETITVEQYTSSSEVTTAVIPGFIRTAGAGVEYDAIPINLNGQFVMLPAVKKAEFEVDYKGINQVLNYDWSIFDGTNFADWDTNPNFPITVGRDGLGTLDDPYKLFIPYPQPNPGFAELRQVIPSPVASLGDVFDVQFKVLFNNTKTLPIRITVRDTGGNTAFSMDSSGKWQPGVGGTVTNILISRSGKKRLASFSVKSEPIPVSVPGITEQTGPFQIRIQIGVPGDPEELEPSQPDGVLIYPIKIGVISIASKGRHITITNGADFSKVNEVEKFTFIDTGEDGLSNTIFTGSGQTPVIGWTSPKPGVETDDIERHMAKGVIDQYQRSVNSWQGVLYSNSLSFYNMIRLAHRPEKLYMQCGDRYNNRDCSHDVTLVECFAEGTGDIQDILEYDIEDTEE